MLGVERRPLAGGVVPGGGAAEVTYESLIADLAPIMWYRFNEPSGTATLNHGSAGAALDGVWTPGVGALAQTGHLGLVEAYDYDALNSRVVVPNTAAHNALPAFTRAFLVNLASAGEAGFGAWYIYGASAGNGGASFGGNLTNFTAAVDTDGTNPAISTDTTFATAVWTWLFITYDNAGDRKMRAYKYVAGVLSQLNYTSQIAGTGNLVTIIGDYYIGNRSGLDITADWLIDEHIVFNYVLSDAEMTDVGDTAEEFYA